MDTTNKPMLNKRLFWDINFSTLDYDVKAGFVIERVFERGDVEDIRQVRRFYGNDLISMVLLETKYLPLRRIYLASAIINKPVSDFRCYILRQSTPELYPY